MALILYMHHPYFQYTSIDEDIHNPRHAEQKSYSDPYLEDISGMSIEEVGYAEAKHRMACDDIEDEDEARFKERRKKERQERARREGAE